MGFLSQEQLKKIGFKSLGKNVLISEYANIYNPSEISLGDYSRVDDFSILSGGEIIIGRYVHIASHCIIVGKGKVTMCDYSGLSSRVAIYSSSDNYDGEWMTNPCTPETVRRTKNGTVYLGKHVVVGTGSTILLDVELPDGCAVGAMSLVTKSFPPNSLLVGIPARCIGQRKSNIFELEKLLP